MIRIRFPNAESKRAALGKLAGRFSFKSWATGEMLVPGDALPFLAEQGVVFTVEGRAAHEDFGTPVPRLPASSCRTHGLTPGANHAHVMKRESSWLP